MQIDNLTPIILSLYNKTKIYKYSPKKLIQISHHNNHIFSIIHSLITFSSALLSPFLSPRRTTVVGFRRRRPIQPNHGQIPLPSPHPPFPPPPLHHRRRATLPSQLLHEAETRARCGGGEGGATAAGGGRPEGDRQEGAAAVDPTRPRRVLLGPTDVRCKRVRSGGGGFGEGFEGEGGWEFAVVEFESWVAFFCSILHRDIAVSIGGRVVR